MTWAERPPRFLCATVGSWLAIVVVTFSDAGVPFPTWTLVSFFGVGLILALLIRVSITHIESRRRQADWIRRNLRWWILTSVMVVAGFLMAATQPLLSVRVYLSAGALRQSAPMLSAVSQSDLNNNGRWVGLFRVREFSQFGSELRFITNECGLVDTCGIVYSPAGRPPSRGEDSFSHLYGSWWHWYQSW